MAGRRWPGTFGSAGWLAGLLLLAVAAGAQAPGEEPAPAAETPANPAPAPVGLDKLLSLPPTQSYTMDRKGGRTRGEWRALFEEVRTALAKERQALAEAEAKLDDKAEAGEWNIAPPIGGQQKPSETPLDFGLRQQIRRHRDEIARLERRERDLDIEANLAAVPEDWRK